MQKGTKMKRVYVAGPYSDDNVISILNNMREGMRAGVEVFLAGFAPFVPWHDFHHTLMLRDGEDLKVNDYYAYSMAWLDVSDAMLVIGDYKKSKGTLAEIKRAEELNIPIYYNMETLIRYEK